MPDKVDLKVAVAGWARDHDQDQRHRPRRLRRRADPPLRGGAGAVDGAEGFEGFELLRPTDERGQWLVITRWRDEESFQARVNSPDLAEGHRSTAERAGGGRLGPEARLTGPASAPGVGPHADPLTAAFGGGAAASSSRRSP